MMKRYLLLIGIIAAGTTCLLAEEKTSLPPNATILTILQGNVGKTVELHLIGGEKIAGKVEQVNDSVVFLSHLTGAEFYDGFANAKDISAIVVRSAGR